jgi:drug/metabolite transporter (DMT)-like permease
VGTVGDTAGYVAQAAALGLGSLLLVQPLLVTTLVWALPLQSWWTRRPPRATDVAWALALAVALGTFVVVGEPTAGLDRAPWERWLPAAAVLGAVVAACAVAAAARRGTTRALLLGVVTGVAYGVVAALTKGVVDALGEGLFALLTTWETYALAGAAVAGTLVQQSAFQAAGLQASLPLIIVGEPVVAVVLGVVVLDEQVRADGAEWVLIGVLVAVMVAATVALARSAAGQTAPVRAGSA